MAWPGLAAGILHPMTMKSRVKNPHPAAALLLEHFARRAMSRRALCQLTPHQWVILRCLGPTAGKACSLHELASALGASLRSADRSVSSLERMNYVTVARESGSGSVGLTPAGQARLQDDPIHRIDAALIRLPPQDKHELCRMLTILIDAHALDDEA